MRITSSSTSLVGLFVFGLGFSACALDPNGTVDLSTRTPTTTGTGGGAGATGSGGGATGSGGGGMGGVGGMGGGQGGATSTSTSAGTGGQGGQGGVVMPDPVCGDGKMDPGEDCDDKNTVPADGCSADCHNEDPDACDGVTIKLAKGTSLQVKGDTTGANNDVQSAANVEFCGGAGPFAGGDLVYTVIPQESGTLVATLNANYSNHWLHTRTACPGTTANEVGCDYATTSSAPDVNTIMNATAGTKYHIFVDGHSNGNNEGSFTLTIELK